MAERRIAGQRDVSGAISALSLAKSPMLKHLRHDGGQDGRVIVRPWGGSHVWINFFPYRSIFQQRSEMRRVTCQNRHDARRPHIRRGRTSLATLVGFALVNLSLLRLRHRKIHTDGPHIRVPLWVPAAGFVSCLAMMAAAVAP